MAFLVGGGRNSEEGRGARGRVSRAATLASRLHAMQKQLNARSYAVLRLNGSGFPSARKLSCALESAAPAAGSWVQDVVTAYGPTLLEHLDSSLLPVLWNGAGDHQVAETSDFARFTRRLSGGNLPFSGIGFPVRLGAQGNGFVLFSGSYLDVASETILDVHGRCCVVMTDLLAAEEKRILPSETLNDREIACLQMAGDGFISEEIAEKMGLSVHTVNAYLGVATTKLDSVNRIQAIAKAIRLGYIS